jgi:hypothetical protein
MGFMTNYKYLIPVLFFLSLAIAFSFYSGINAPVIGTDDANIFFIYARNLANGQGFVYNPEGQKVEGVSSVLWVLIAALGFLITENPEILLLAFNIILLVIEIVFAVRFIERRIAETVQRKNQGISWQSLFFMTALFGNPGFFFWTTLSLLESGFWTFLLFLCAMMVLELSFSAEEVNNKKNWLFCFLLFLIILTRPEGIAWSLGFSLLFIHLHYSHQQKGKIQSFYFFPLITSLISALSLLGFRLLYFGDPLPNTFYAKVSPNFLFNLRQGMKYLEGYLRENFLIAPTVLFICLFLFVYFLRISGLTEKSFLLFKMCSFQNRFMFSLGFLVIMGLTIPIVTGGDGFGLYRFYQPIWPFIVLTFVYLVSCFFKKAGAKISSLTGFSTLFAVAIFILTISISMELKWNRIFSSQPTSQVLLAKEGRKIGQYMNELFGDIRPVVGIYCAGGIKFMYDGEAFDLLGLNHREMAHAPGEKTGQKGHSSFSKGVFYKNLPHLIVPRVSDSPEKYLQIMEHFSFPLNGLQKEEKFRNLYQLAAVTKGKKRNHICAFYRKDFLDKLKKSGSFRTLIIKN